MMRSEIHPGEILDLLKSEISGFSPEGRESEVGRVMQTGDGIVHVWGLDSAMSGELVEIEVSDGSRVQGMVMNIEEESISIILFGGYDTVREGDTAFRTGTVVQVPAGESLQGRVVDALGRPIDGKGALKDTEERQVEVKGPGIVGRRNVFEPLHTGIKAIDAMIPIGRGQRELIIGDRRTGKTAIAIDTIINQSQMAGKEKVHCFYAAIGQKRSSVVQLVEELRKYNALENTTIISASASDPASLQFLAPYTACAMAEYYRDNGRHALVVYDDLTKHAQAYREISLLMRRSPGREAYPGDIFYIHSRLLERAAKMSDEKGGGSLTALPIVETQDGDVSAYIPTNIISITDGQIYLESDLFNSGLRPAINVGISVSRVGGDAQVRAMRQTAGSLRIELAQFRELASFMQFSSDLDSSTKDQLNRGERLTEILKQPQYRPIDVYRQIMILRAGITGRLDKYSTSVLRNYEAELFAFLDGAGKEFLDKLRAEGIFNDELESEADRVLDEFEKTFDPEKSRVDVDSGYTANLALALSKAPINLNRNMLRLVEQVTARELSSPSLEKELEKIITGKDTFEKDRFDHLVESCRIIEAPADLELEDAFTQAARMLSEADFDETEEEILDKFHEREKTSSTAISTFFAIPHVVLDEKNKFDMIIMRSKKGIYFTETAPNVHALFFLAGSMDQRHFHLVVLSAIARIVQEEDFEKQWLKAEDVDSIRRLIMRTRRKKQDTQKK